MEGFLIIDKPQGITSHDAVGRVRRISNIRRVGHAGTLDPLATGVLVVGIGRATRLIEYIVGRPKTYVATILLGQATDTYDADGDITQRQPLPPHLTSQHIEEALKKFQGQISQIPPMYSAIKKDGQPLYKLARQGKEVERKARQVTVYALTLESWVPPYLKLVIQCSAGTYIRSIAHDLGIALGVGGHITQLRRTAVGHMSVTAAVNLSTLTSEVLSSRLLATDTAVDHFPKLILTEDEREALFDGKVITAQDNHPTDALVRAYGPSQIFAGMVTRQDNCWRAKKMFPPSGR